MRDRAFDIVFGVIAVAVVLAVIAGFVWLVGPARASWWEDHQTERGRGDSPVTGIIQEPRDDESEDPVAGIVAIEMPDDFSGFATRCVWEGLRGFSTTNDGGAAIVEDPDCEMPEVVAPADAHR